MNSRATFFRPQYKKENNYQNKLAKKWVEDARNFNRLASIGSGIKTRNTLQSGSVPFIALMTTATLFAVMKGVDGLEDNPKIEMGATSRNDISFSSGNVTAVETSQVAEYSAASPEVDVAANIPHIPSESNSATKKRKRKKIVVEDQKEEKKEIVKLPEDALSQRIISCIEIDPELKTVLTEESIRKFQIKIINGFKKLYSLSAENQKHLDYAFKTTPLKILMVQETADTFLTFAYDNTEHKIRIAIPPDTSKKQYTVNPSGVDIFDEIFYKQMMHEVQHARTAIINSDKTCDPATQNKKQEDSGKFKFLSLPKNPNQIEKIINKSQKYILEDLANLKAKNDNNALSNWDNLLKDYIPRRHMVILDASAIANWKNEGKIERLEKGEHVPHVFINPITNKPETLYVDLIIERHGNYYGLGHFVKDPTDKVSALISDTLYNKEIMPKFYEAQFSTHPHHKQWISGEEDGYVYEVSNLKILQKLYPELVKLHEQSAIKSKCQPSK